MSDRSTGYTACRSCGRDITGETQFWDGAAGPDCEKCAVWFNTPPSEPAKPTFYKPGELDSEASHRVWLAQRIEGLGRYQLAEFTLAMLNTEVPRPDAPFSSGVRPEVCVAEDRRNLITALLLGDSLSSSGPEPELK